MIISVFIMEILPKLGIDIRPFLTAAGVLGVAVGFGSKQLVEDVISGFNIIMQGQIFVGDIIEVDGKIGTVEKLNLKMVALRDWDGKVHFISKSGLFKIGLLPRVYNLCKEYGLDVKIIDHRRVVYPSIKSIKIPKAIGGLKLRPEQKLAVSSVLYNQVGGITYRVGIIEI